MAEDLEKKFLESAFRNLERNIICPNKDCDKLGNHFICYDSTYENCYVYQHWKEQYAREDKLSF